MLGKSNYNALNSVPQTPEKVNQFKALLVNYALECKNTSTTTYANTLTELATAVAYSVLKKCILTSGNKSLEKFRQDIARASHNADRYAYSNENAYKTVCSENGDIARTVNDLDCAKTLSELSHGTIGDGYDLVHDAIVAILEETAKQTDREPDEPIDLERPYTVRRLKRKVWIKSTDSVNGWEVVETTPIKEIYRAVRRAITVSMATVTDPRNGYTYLEDLTSDPKTGDTITIYRRLPKYADLGGYVTDFNGATTLYTVDTETVDRYGKMVEKLNLTTKQAQVLQLKQSGHGNKSIATYLGISENSVKGAMTEIKRKAKERFPDLFASL